MRLRYLFLKNYPPLNDIALSFSAESPLQRECAIRFVVGVNGSGKTHLLQALLEVFLCLARQHKPHFPVTIVYELGKGERARTLIFDNPGVNRKTGWWQSESNETLLPNSYQIEDWQLLITKVREGLPGWEGLIENGNWPGKKVGLPRTVLAYTTGEIVPWQILLHREPPATEVDIISQSLDYDTGQERPTGWSLYQEIAFQGQIGTDEGLQRVRELKKAEEDYSTKETEQEICLLITPLLLKFALLAVSLPLSMEEFRKFKTEKDQKSFFEHVGSAPEQGKGLHRLFNQAGWIRPVCVSFTVDFKPNEWTDKEKLFKKPELQALYAFASEVIREPEPSTKRRLYFDLNEKNSDDFARVLSEESMVSHFGASDAFEFVGDALIQFLGGRGGQPNDRFKRLLELHQQSIIEDIQISLRSSRTDDILLFDELSDGEQVFLGRMALFHLMKGQDDALFLLDEPEVHFNDKWKRELFDIIEQSLGNNSHQVVISTHSGITLTDVLAPEITLFKIGKNGQTFIEDLSNVNTFGATSDHPLRDIFGATGTVGKRASALLDILLAAEHNPDLVEAYWGGLDLGYSDIALNKLFKSGFGKTVQNLYENQYYDEARIEQCLKLIHSFAKEGQDSLTVIKAIERIVSVVGPGYYQYDLYRSLHRMNKNEGGHAS